MDVSALYKRLPVLHKYLGSDGERQLQALYALQALSDAFRQLPRKRRFPATCRTSPVSPQALRWSSLEMTTPPLSRFPGLLQVFFDLLLHLDLISTDVFRKWRTSADPAEQRGKAAALKSVTPFFTWLQESEEPSDTRD